MGDWADEKAREWVRNSWGTAGAVQRTNMDSLAALLREVYGRAKSETLVQCCICEDVTAPRPDCDCVICHRNRTLAEMRRVVKGVLREFERRERCANGCNCSGEVDAADEILSRLDKL